MIEMRWLTTWDEDKEQKRISSKRKLQYRQKIDTTIRAGMWSNMKIVETANYQWSEWHDVPEIGEIYEN